MDTKKMLVGFNPGVRQEGEMRWQIVRLTGATEPVRAFTGYKTVAPHESFASQDEARAYAHSQGWQVIGDPS